MLCDVCKKIEATVHLTEIVNGKVKKMHLCERCAQEKSQEMETHFGLSDLLSGLSDISAPPKSQGRKSLKCTFCQATYYDFQKTGRLGCSRCYELFSKNLSPLLRRIHGNDRHIGKSPFTMKPRKVNKAQAEFLTLKQKLQRAIEKEEFEDAAKYRDQIKAIEKRTKGKK